MRGAWSSRICDFPSVTPSAKDLCSESRLSPSSALVVGRHDASRGLKLPLASGWLWASLLSPYHDSMPGLARSLAGGGVR